MSPQLIGLVLALVSAFGFALSSALQHHANHGVTSTGAGSHLKALLRTPRWVVGQVLASVSFVLGQHVEHLVLTGTGDLAGTGNDGANLIEGNAGAKPPFAIRHQTVVFTH